MSYKMQRFTINAEGGISGVDYVDIETGPPGPPGPEGPQGPQGVAGAQGTAGTTGATGSTGPAGSTGAQGIQGVKGDTGDTGLTGSQGPQGNTGSQGTQGIQGIQGIQGVQGVPGPNITTSAFGYGTGAGGAVTQATSKATGVTLNKLCGAITMHNAALAAAAEVSFTVTNSTVGARDVIIVNHAQAGTGGAYSVEANTIAAGSFRITVGNWSAGSLGEAIVLNYAVIKAVNA